MENYSCNLSPMTGLICCVIRIHIYVFISDVNDSFLIVSPLSEHVFIASSGTAFKVLLKYLSLFVYFVLKKVTDFSTWSYSSRCILSFTCSKLLYDCFLVIFTPIALFCEKHLCFNFLKCMHFSKSIPPMHTAFVPLFPNLHSRTMIKNMSSQNLELRSTLGLWNLKFPFQKNRISRISPRILMVLEN